MQEKKKNITEKGRGKERMMVVGKVSPHLLSLILEECRGRKIKKFIYHELLPERIRNTTHVLCTPAIYKANKEMVKKLAQKTILRILVKKKEDLCHIELGENVDGVFFDSKLKAMIDIHFSHILSSPEK